MATTRFIEPEERELLLKQLPGARDRLLVVLGLNSGLRVSSILSLRWKQLWRDGRPINVLEVPRRHLKGGRSARRRQVTSRRVPVNSTLAEAIQAYATSVYAGAEITGEELVFRSPRRDGAALTRQQVYNIITGAAGRAGLEHGVAPHGLRRSFGQDVCDATGHDLVAAQLLLGHSSPLVTAAYLKPRQAELDQVVMRLPFREAAIAAPESIQNQLRISGT
jgi:integrase